MKTDGRTELLGASYHFRKRKRFYGDLIPPEIIKCTYVFM